MTMSVVRSLATIINMIVIVEGVDIHNLELEIEVKPKEVEIVTQICWVSLKIEKVKNN